MRTVKSMTEIQAQTQTKAEALDRRFVFHPFTKLDEHAASDAPVIVSGHGSTLTDSRGRTFLDAMAGLWCVNIGYGRREVADALRDEALRLGYYHAFSSLATDLPAELAERILAMAPAGMSKIFFGNSGSDANDTQIKLVWYYNNVLGRPQKKKIIARHRGYHGVTIDVGEPHGLRSCTPASTCRSRSSATRALLTACGSGEPGESEEAFAQRLADELER